MLLALPLQPRQYPHPSPNEQNTNEHQDTEEQNTKTQDKAKQHKRRKGPPAALSASEIGSRLWRFSYLRQQQIPIYQ
jgi:hypothetical protein